MDVPVPSFNYSAEDKSLYTGESRSLEKCESLNAHVEQSLPASHAGWVQVSEITFLFKPAWFWSLVKV